MNERNGVSMSGWFILLVVVVGAAYAANVLIVLFTRTGIPDEVAIPIIQKLGLVVAAVIFLVLPGFFISQPNERKVLTFLGHYIGTVKNSGFRWTVPFFKKKKVSIRLRNFETKQLKVNDANGNPIEIGAIVVWRVNDTAKALFEVDNFDNFINIQSESALRTIAMRFPYENHQGESSLTSHTEEVAALLEAEIAQRVIVAGIDVTEARISHLAYSREIAHSMLQKQQAHAVVMARQTIIEGAIGLVEMAIEQLETRKIVELSEDKKADLVSNLLVVLCSEGESQPIVDVGTR